MRKAFTLVELLVAIAILSILVAMIWGAIAGHSGDKPEAGPGKPYLVEEDEPEPVAEAPPAAQGSFMLTRGYPVRVTVDGQYYTLLAPKGGGFPTIERE